MLSTSLISSSSNPWKLPSRRSPVMGKHGMVSTSQPQATRIGYDILRRGGNAMDAAIAISAALSVTEPCSTGIGGDCFALFYDCEKQKVFGVNGSGRCPESLTVEKVVSDCQISVEQQETASISPPTHAHAVTVPGAVAGWVDSLERFGSGLLTLAEILDPAIELAENGFPVSPITAYQWKLDEDLLKQQQAWSLLSPVTGNAPTEGEIFYNHNLARCLREIQRNGKSAFYEGRIAQKIVECIQKNGGVMSLNDLKNHYTTFPEPISTEFEGIEIFEIPPNGQGIATLLALNILKHLEVDLNSENHNSVEYLHTLIEVMRISFADIRWFVADSETVPIEQLLSDDYAKERSLLFNRDHASVDIIRGSPEKSSCTVSFQVVDQFGNAVSFVNSNYMGFGSGLTPEDCGFSLHNRGHNFSLNPNHPNCLAPCKRPYHTIIPGMALVKESKQLFSTFSNMGGFMQPQGHLQLLVNLIRCRMNPQEAVDAPRFCIQDGTSNGLICLEEGISNEIAEELRRKGHKIVVLSKLYRFLFGRAQMIVKSPINGVLWAGSDGRADGCAMGW